jgi:hypothetical protein
VTRTHELNRIYDSMSPDSKMETEIKRNFNLRFKKELIGNLSEAERKILCIEHDLKRRGRNRYVR